MAISSIPGPFGLILRIWQEAVTSLVNQVIDLVNTYIPDGNASFKTLSVNGALPKEAVTVTIASPAVVTWPEIHSFTAGDSFVWSTSGELPTGITAGQVYYVIATGLTSTTFQFSETVGGAAVNTSGSQSGTQYISQPLMGVNGQAYFGDPNAVYRPDAGAQVIVRRDTNIGAVLLLRGMYDAGAGTSWQIIAANDADDQDFKMFGLNSQAAGYYNGARSTFFGFNYGGCGWWADYSGGSPSNVNLLTMRGFDAGSDMGNMSLGHILEPDYRLTVGAFDNSTIVEHAVVRNDQANGVKLKYNPSGNVSSLETIGSGTKLQIKSGGVQTCEIVDGIQTFNQPFLPGTYTVATLPTPASYMIASVSDGAAALAWGATVTGGGLDKYLVWYNGTNWTVFGK